MVFLLVKWKSNTGGIAGSIDKVIGNTWLTGAQLTTVKQKNLEEREEEVVGPGK